MLDPKVLSRDALATVEQLSAIYPAYFLARPSVEQACVAFAEQFIEPWRRRALR